MTSNAQDSPPKDHAHPYEIARGLFISGHPDHTNDWLRRGIDAVVDLEGDVDTAIPQGEGQKATTLYLYWPIEDGPMPDPTTVRAIASMMAGLMAEDKEVLVHCRSGHNRSGMICARTLMVQGMAAQKAIDTVRSKRGDGHALENENFVSWLLEEEAD
jgi:protein-tyrosine phosphatase